MTSESQSLSRQLRSCEAEGQEAGASNVPLRKRRRPNLTELVQQELCFLSSDFAGKPSKISSRYNQRADFLALKEKMMSKSTSAVAVTPSSSRTLPPPSQVEIVSSSSAAPSIEKSSDATSENSVNNTEKIADKVVDLEKNPVVPPKIFCRLGVNPINEFFDISSNSTGEPTAYCHLEGHSIGREVSLFQKNTSGKGFSFKTDNAFAHFKNNHKEIFHQMCVLNDKWKNSTNDNRQENFNALVKFASEVRGLGEERLKAPSKVITLDAYAVMMTKSQIETLDREYQACLHVLFLVTTNASFYSVDSYMGRHFLSHLKEGKTAHIYHSRQLQNKFLPMVYEFIVSRQESKLQDSPAFSLTFDLWTTKNQTKAFIGVNFHFVTAEMKATNIVIDLIPITEKHSAGKIAILIAQRIDQHTTESQILHGVVSDHASNVIKAGRLLLCKLDEIQAFSSKRVTLTSDEETEFQNILNAPIEDGENGYVDGQMGCVAHAFHLVIECSLQSSQMRSLRNLSIKISNLMGAIRRSTARMEFLDETQKLLNNDGKSYRPLLHVSTRWNSLVDMFARYELLHESLIVAFGDSVFDESEVDLDALSDVEMGTLKAAMEPLNFIRNFNDFFQGDYFTLPHLPYAIREIKEKLFSLMNNPNASKFGADLAVVLYDQMTSRFDKYLLPLSSSVLASMLHPVHHLTFDSFQEDEKTSIVAKLASWMMQLSPASEANETALNPKRQWKKPMTTTSNADVAQNQVSSLLYELDKFATSNPNECKFDLHEPQNMDVVLRKFYLLPCINHDMRQLARLVFSQPSSSAASERLFSRAGLVYSERRTCLSEESLEMLVVVGQYAKCLTEKEVPVVMNSLKDWFIQKIKDRSKT